MFSSIRGVLCSSPCLVLTFLLLQCFLACLAQPDCTSIVANDGSTYNLTPLLDSTQLTRPIDPLSPYWYKFAVCGGINVGCGVGYCNFDYTAGLCQSWANFTNTASEACCGQAAVANVTGFDGGTGVSIYYTAGDLDRTTEIIVNCNALPGFGTIALNDSDGGNFFFFNSDRI